MKSTYLANKQLSTALTGATVHLYTTAPGPDNTGTELVAGGYTPQPTAFTVTDNTAANDADIVFGPAAEAWPTVTHIAVFDGTGNLVYGAALSASKTLVIGDRLEIAAGDLDVTEEVT